MPEDLKVPGLGQVPKKYVIGGVVVAGGIVVIAYMRHRSAAQTADTSTAATTDASAIDPTTGIPYSQESSADSSGIDPSTGIPYAEETAGASDYGGGYGSYQTEGYDAAGYPLGSEADLQWQATQAGTTTNSITTNEQWLEEAESGVIPGSASTIGNALSRVLGGLPVTNAQRSLFLEAVGLLGNPPGGYPQPIKLKDTAAQPGGGKTKTVTASGTEDLSQIAHANKTTGGELVKLNIFLAPYYGNTRKIKKGTKIKVP